MSTSLLDLPDEVLKAVLQRVPPKEQFSCRLVHSRLHAAAVAATDTLGLVFRRFSQSASFPAIHINQADCFLAWIGRHGCHLTRLSLRELAHPLRQLPCPRLQQLELSGGQVQLDAGGGHPGVLQGCTNLTKLELSGELLDRPNVPGTPLVIDGLSALVQLQHLRFEVSGRRALAFSEATLPRLQHLTHLAGRVPGPNVLQLGALTSLESLVCYSGGGETALGPGTYPGLQLPAPLKLLILGCRAEAAILSVIPTGLDALYVDTLEGPAEGPSSFLAGLARLQQLTKLNLEPSDPLAWPPPGPAYAALTASSSLMELVISSARCSEGDPPAGIWPHVFPATHRLPHLTSLIVNKFWRAEPDYTPPWAWGAADVAALVACCPNLRRVPSTCMRHGRHVSALRSLTALTWLGLHYGTEGGHATFADMHASLRGLAALTQLQCLGMSLGFTLPGACALLPLTSLARLTCLSCEWQLDPEDEEEEVLDDEGFPVEDPAGRVLLTSTQGDGPPDVWQQLLDYCSEGSS